MKKTLWLENLVLFNQAVQKSGGIMHIYDSHTDNEGDVFCFVEFSKLNLKESENYEEKRIKK